MGVVSLQILLDKKTHSTNTTQMKLFSDRSVASHLVQAGEGGAERPDLRWTKSDLSVECERV